MLAQSRTADSDKRGTLAVKTESDNEYNASTTESRYRRALRQFDFHFRNRTRVRLRRWALARLQGFLEFLEALARCGQPR